jgi:metal-responsive CopG/Arc/MetJ family transcriptional regulator
VKITISMDNRMLQEADDTVRRMGLNRSRLFALAVGDFLQRHRPEQLLVRAAEKRLLKGIKAKVSRTVRDPW